MPPRLVLIRLLSILAVLVGLLGASEPAHATYPGTNDGRLAFGMTVGGNVDIYSVLPNGNDLRRLTSDASFDACPSYSPDGKEIAFCSNRSGATEIWKMKQNGTKQERVTHLNGSVTFPDFSPELMLQVMNDRARRDDRLRHVRAAEAVERLNLKMFAQREAGVF